MDTVGLEFIPRLSLPLFNYPSRLSAKRLTSRDNPVGGDGNDRRGQGRVKSWSLLLKIKLLIGLYLPKHIWIIQIPWCKLQLFRLIFTPVLLQRGDRLGKIYVIVGYGI